MATINVSFDTVEKTLAVTRDGAEVPDVCGVYIGRAYNDPDLDEDDFRIEVMQQTPDAEHDLCTYTRLVASETAEGQTLAAAGASEAVPGFVPAGTKCDVGDDVLAYFGRKG